MARAAGLDQLADVRPEHLHLLRSMHNVGLKWAEKFLTENESLVFRLGYHSVCSSLLSSMFLPLVQSFFLDKYNNVTTVFVCVYSWLNYYCLTAPLVYA